MTSLLDTEVTEGEDTGAGESAAAQPSDGTAQPPVEMTHTAAILAQIQAQAAIETLRITAHAREAMRDEAITLDEVLEAIATGQILENYPEHRRGACCLLAGRTAVARPLHIVCTSTQPVLMIITVYEPQLPKWLTPTQRRPQA